MRKKKIVIHTNSPLWKTGLGENGRYLAEYLYKTGKYEIIYYCSNLNERDPSLQTMPWKAYGAISSDPAVHQQIGNDPGKQRDMAYGAHNIDKVIETEKPDIYWGSDDIWGFNGYVDKPWWNKINSTLHITVDSRPVLGHAFEQAKKTKNYTVWSKFAEEEMKRAGPEYQHIKTIYGGFDIEDFKPISSAEKLSWRKKFGINPNTTIFLMVNRNQLRKGFNHAIAAFADFKRENPNANAKLHFHTAFHEKGHGFDIMQTANTYGVKAEDILCTYVCKHCGQWHVGPYKGEDIDCPFCGTKKSCITPSIVHGIPDSEMKYLHGIADAGLSIFTSGGLERFSVTSMLCGLYTCVTNYSCGEDFCKQPFVYSLPWAPYYEPGNNFIKAATSVPSIKAFMAKVNLMSRESREKVGKQSRDWAVATFAADVVGKQWDEMFDQMPLIDWSKIQLSYQRKNEDYPMPPDTLSDIDFIDALYQNVLFLPEPHQGDGHQGWQAKLKSSSLTRRQIYDFFILTAKTDNARNSAPKDFDTVLTKNGRKRGLFLLKESIGDIMMSTALFKSFAAKYPDTDLYVMTDEKYHEILEGNPYIHKLLPYSPQFENELMVLGAGRKEGYFDFYFHPAIATQRHLAYLGRRGPNDATMKLITTYAAATGLDIDRPLIHEKFFPLGFSKYITIQTGSGQALKNYDRWNDVLRLLAPALQREGIQVVHLGGKDDVQLPGTVSLCGIASPAQSLYVLRRSSLHLGNDSWQAHLSAEAGVPLVALYGTTSADIHGPYWKNADKTVLIESHRGGNKHSFGLPEANKTINLISPEDVANAGLKLLNLPDKAAISKTHYIGPYYGHNLFEVVPNMVLDPALYPQVPATVRMDYLFNEENLLKQAQTRKVHIFTKQPIKLDLLKAIMPNVLGFNFEVDLNTDITYLKDLKKLGGKQILFSKETDQKTLDDIRFRLFDVSTVEFVETKTKAKFLMEASDYLNTPLTELPPDLKVSSSKLLFAEGKVYLSRAHLAAGDSVASIENPTSNLIDSPEFWADYLHYHVYN